LEGNGSAVIVITWNLSGGNEENSETPVRIAGVSAEIQTEHLPNTSL
jgi:hypothetical protein